MIRSIIISILLVGIILTGCNKKDAVNPSGEGVANQENTVMGLIYSGKVVDGADNSPLAGAHVVRKTSQGGVTTELDGTFSIWIESFLTQVLVISSTGYLSKEISVDPSHTNLGTIKLYLAP